MNAVLAAAWIAASSLSAAPPARPPCIGAVACQAKCEAGDLRGCVEAARWIGEWRSDQSTRVADLEKACAGKVHEGCVELANHLVRGSGLKTNSARATALLKQACDAGLVTGCVALAELYFRQSDSPGEPRGRALLEAACAKRSPEGCSALIWQRQRGKALSKDEAARYQSLRGDSKAREWLVYQLARKTAEDLCAAGVAIACNKRAMLGQPGDAQPWNEKACDLGAAECQPQ